MSLLNLIQQHQHQLIIPNSDFYAQISVEQTDLNHIVKLYLNQKFHIKDTSRVFTIKEIYQNNFDGYFYLEDAICIIQSARFIPLNPEETLISSIKDLWDLYFSDYLLNTHNVSELLQQARTSINESLQEQAAEFKLDK